MFNFLSNLVHGVGNFIGGLTHPQPQQQHPNVVQNVIHTVGQAEQNVAHAVPRVLPNVIHTVQPVIRSINGSPIVHNVENFAGQYAHGVQQGAQGAYKVANALGLVHPLVEGGQQLTNLSNQLGGQLYHNKAMAQAAKAQGGVNTRKLLTDAALTGLNFAGGAEAPGLLKGASLGSKVIRGGLAGAGLGATQGGLQSVHDKSNFSQTAHNVLGGAAGGALLGGAIPVAGAGAKLAIKGVKTAAGEVRPLAQALARPLQTQRGSLGMGEDLNLKSPSGINSHLDFLDQQHAALSNRLTIAREEINRLNIPAGQKTKALSKVQDELNAEGKALQQEKAIWTTELQKIGGKRNPEQNIPEGVPLTTKTQLDQQIAESNKPTLGQKAAQGLRTALGKDNVPLSSDKITLGEPKPSAARRFVNMLTKATNPLKDQGGYINFGENLDAQKASDTMAQELADHLRSLDKENGGVTRVPGENGAQIRQSTNSPFYRAYYKEHGKPPTKAAYLEEAHRQLATGNSPEAQAYQATAKLGGAGDQLPATSQEPKAVPTKIPPKENKFVQSVKSSPEVSPQVQEQISGQHAVRNTQAAVDTAKANIGANGLDSTTNQTLEHLAVTPGHATDQQLAQAIQVAKAHDALGTPEGHDMATRIYESIAEHGVASGQRSQILSTLASRTPEGQKYQALKVLKKAGVTADDKLKAKIQIHIDALKTAPDGSQAQYEAQQALAKTVNKALPAKNQDKLFRLWRTGLLTGPQTMTKVGISHAIMNGMEAASNVPATALDSLLSHFTGNRTTALTGRGSVSGFAQGTKAAVKLLGTGKDTIDTGGFKGFNTELGRPQAEFKGAFKWLNPYMNKTEQIHAAIPKGFFTSAYRNDLNKQAIAAYKNAVSHAKLNGTEAPASRSEFIKNFVDHPTEAAHAEAEHAGQMATFQQETKLGKVAAKMQAVPGGKVLSPFAHIASAILTDAANYSPVGAAKTVIEAARDAKAGGWTPQVQKHFVEGIGRSITGTALVATGAALYKNGLMTLDYPKDPKEAQLWKETGKQPNSVLIGGKWRQLATLGPQAITLAMGGYLNSGSQVGGKGNAAISAVAGALKTLSGESFLSGVTGAAGAINNPEMSAKSFLKNEASSVIPIAVGTVAKAFDPLERQTNSIGEALASKIPGLRQALTPQQTTLGQTIPRQGGVLTNLLDPTRPTNVVSSPVLDELNRLAGTQNVVSPVPVKTIGSGKNAVNLTPQQQFDRTAQVGPQIQQAYQHVMNAPGYAQLSDANKAKALTNAASDVNAVGNVQTLVNAGKQQQAQIAYKGLSSNQKAMFAGQPSVKNYTALDENGKSLSGSKVAPNVTYQQHLAAFQQQVKAGTLSPTQIYKTQLSLGKEAITSQYSQEVQDLYGMSKADRSAYLDQNPGSQKLMSQVKDLSAKLASAHFTATDKLANESRVAAKKAATATKKYNAAKTKVAKLAMSRMPKTKAVKVARIKAVKAPRIKTPKIAKARSTSSKIKLIA